MSTLADRKRNLGRVPVKWIVLAAYILLVLVSRWVTSADRLPKPELAQRVEFTPLGSPQGRAALPVIVIPRLPDGGADLNQAAVDLVKIPKVADDVGPVYAIRWPTAYHRSRASMSDESIADAGKPMRVEWHTESRIHIPISN